MQLAKQLIQSTISENRVQAEKIQYEINRMISEMSNMLKRVYELQSDNRSLEMELTNLNYQSSTTMMANSGLRPEPTMNGCSVLQPEKRIIEK